MKKLTTALGVIAFLAAAGSASAASITFNLVSAFSGAQPTNTLTATFTDAGVNQVDLTMKMLGASTTEFVDEWVFNFNGDATTLSTSLISDNTGAGTPPAVSLFAPGLGYQADGDGKYDIRIVFDNAPPSQRFTTGETVVIRFTGTGITAASFDALSDPAGGSGPFPTAAHVQGIAANPTSGWVTVPEPSGAILFGIGTMIAGIAIRRRS